MGGMEVLRRKGCHDPRVPRLPLITSLPYKKHFRCKISRSWNLPNRQKVDTSRLIWNLVSRIVGQLRDTRVYNAIFGQKTLNYSKICSIDSEVLPSKGLERFETLSAETAYLKVFITLEEHRQEKFQASFGQLIAQ